jgi:protein TonB
MFEECLVESRGLPASRTQRWTALGSITLQCAVAGLLIAIPLFHPQALPMRIDAPHLVLPLLPPRPPVEPVRTPSTASPSTAMSAPAGPAPIVSGPLIWPHPGMPVSDDPVPSIITAIRMGPGGTGVLGDLAGMGGGSPSATVAPARKPDMPHLSLGVTNGMLLAPIEPVYPVIARAAGIQGTVVLEAVISQAGKIESLHAVSGPQMLRGAALDAVSLARYKPYLLNGVPIEVQATITVVFRLGS